MPSKNKKLSPSELYDMQFGSVPDTNEERITNLFDCRSAKSVKNSVDEVIADLKKIKSKKLVFTWNTLPHPSHRPRVNMRSGYVHMYVPMAAATKTDFQKFIKELIPDFKMITTPMKFHIKVYMKTPESMPRFKKILCELGVIKPWGRVADCDNLLKTYTDCAIESLIADDGLIHDMRCEKFYSLKPRVEFEITYSNRWLKCLADKEQNAL